jgi:hypothetical protein
VETCEEELHRRHREDVPRSHACRRSQNERLSEHKFTALHVDCAGKTELNSGKHSILAGREAGNLAASHGGSRAAPQRRPTGRRDRRG